MNLAPLLGGFARCGACHYLLHERPTEQGRVYACLALPGRCGRISVDADQLDTVTGDRALDYMNTPAVRRWMQATLMRQRNNPHYRVFAEENWGLLMASWWADSSVPERRELLRDLLDHVSIAEDGTLNAAMWVWITPDPAPPTEEDHDNVT